MSDMKGFPTPSCELLWRRTQGLTTTLVLIGRGPQARLFRPWVKDRGTHLNRRRPAMLLSMSTLFGASRTHADFGGPSAEALLIPAGPMLAGACEDLVPRWSPHTASCQRFARSTTAPTRWSEKYAFNLSLYPRRSMVSPDSRVGTSFDIALMGPSQFPSCSHCPECLRSTV